MGNKVKPFAIAGVAMVIAFFGPWIDFFGYIQASGYDLATADRGNWKQHLLWLYPLGGAAIAYLAFRGDPRTRSAAFLLGGAVVGLALYDTVTDLADALRYGAWITIGGSLIAFASGLTKGDRAWAVAGGALVLIGFFLPWLGEGRHAMSGFDLARLPHSPDPLPSPKWLYLVPLFGGIAAASAFVAQSQGRLLAIIGGAGALGVLVFLYLRTLNMMMGWGIWVTLLAGLAMLVGAALLQTPRLTSKPVRC
jgi:hypothetical protein